MKIGTRSKMWTLAAAAMVATGLAAAPAGACPPSEGELDLEQVDLSGDGMVALPEGTHWKVLPKTSTTNAQGKIVVDDRVALVLASAVPVAGEKEAAGAKERSVLTVKMNLTAAGEVREWLASAVESQERYLKDAKKTEPAGMSCTLNTKQCRDAAKDKKIEMPSMYVAITSRDGAERHGWMAWGGEKAAGCGGAGEAKAAVPVDERITLTAYQVRTGASDPLKVKMDLPTAKVLLADLGRAIDERNGKVVPVEAEDPGTKRKVISASEG